MPDFDKVALDDKYALAKGRVFISGVQALVRLPLLQRSRDLANGLDTAGFISGYRGSPLGGYDRAIIDAGRWLQAQSVHFEPGLNEDLAATSIWGSQQLNLFDGALKDGVFGIWYGKGPGADRCDDVFKHANGAGTAKYGGVLAIVGDDHGCQSSTMPHQSEQIFIAAMMPVVAPATLQDYLDFGLMGFALSRYSGNWVGVKAVAQTIETAGTVEIDPMSPGIVVPADFDMPAGGLNIRLADPPLQQESRLHGPRMAAVAAFARANRFDCVIWNSLNAKIGLVAAGKAYLDLCEALAELRIDEATADRLGIRLYKLGLVWPLEEEGIKAFAEGLDEIIVVEEKRSVIEDQIARILYGQGSHPVLVGKRDENHQPFLPSEGEIDPVLIGRKLGARIAKRVRDGRVEQNVARLEQLDLSRSAIETIATRASFFCSGCPHNTSTVLPEGSRGLAGIGCHGMVVSMPERRTPLYSHMGGEGLAWVGQAPFTSERHVFQNLGDGTYSHSGLLAIRAAAVAGVNITYKILYNDAVAMTGGQAIEGGLTVHEICEQVTAEGAKRVVVVTDDPGKYDSGRLPFGIKARPREDLDAVQRELREVQGLSILVYDQTCAAEKRRRRKRGRLSDPDQRIFINAAVCENCGDCTAKSNCISVQPLHTDLGRKRKIDQSACNKDFSCVRGFCPSFVSVSGASMQKPARAWADPDPMLLPEPSPIPFPDGCSILVTGIGGTGVITIGAVVGMAARLDGKHCTVLDSTGMAQKNGAVLSHIRIHDQPAQLSSRIPAAGADLVLACDMVVATTPTAVSTIRSGHTRVIANETVVPTSTFIRDRNVDLGEARLRRALISAAGKDGLDFVPAQSLAEAWLGDAIATNTVMLGFAFQRGLLPVSLKALDRAIEMNGAAVDLNRQAFELGRRAAIGLTLIDDDDDTLKGETEPSTVDALIDHRSRLLREYQNAAYSQRYRNLVETVRRAESALAGSADAFALAVARNAAKLMAYKDEYEVARLYTDGRFAEQLRSEFQGKLKIQVHLAPPIFTRRDPSGEPKKRAFGPWILKAMRVLAKMKFLRGTPLDPFGRLAERRIERSLVDEYESTMRDIAAKLSSRNHAIAVEIAELPDSIRGFGHIKLQSVGAANRLRAQLLQRFEAKETVSEAVT